MKSILSRLKSPVVLVQLVVIIGTIIVLLDPQLSGTVKVWVGAVSTIVNVVSGLNNPSSSSSF